MWNMCSSVYIVCNRAGTGGFSFTCHTSCWLKSALMACAVLWAKQKWSDMRGTVIFGWKKKKKSVLPLTHNSWTEHKGFISVFSVYDSCQYSWGVTLQRVTSLNTHSLPSPHQQPHLPLEPHWLRGTQECCVCNVTAIFYSCQWSVWVALLETGTQSLLPVNTNLMGPTGWEELQQLGEDGMYKKWTTTMCQTRAKSSEREKVAA